MKGQQGGRVGLEKGGCPVCVEREGSRLTYSFLALTTRWRGFQSPEKTEQVLGDKRRVQYWTC